MLTVYDGFDPDPHAGEVEFKGSSVLISKQLKRMSSILILFMRALYIPGMGCPGEKYNYSVLEVNARLNKESRTVCFVQ